MSVLEWPVHVLTPRTLAVDLAPRTLAGAASVNGNTQVVSSSAGLWSIAYGEIPVLDEDAIKCWRALVALLEGRLTPIRVTISRMYQPAGSAEADGLYGGGTPHSDGTLFSDGTGYVERVIDVQLTAGMAKGATSAAIAINYADEIEPGQHFSIGDRLYRIKSIVYTDTDRASITFTPPAREAASTGAQLEFDDPSCLMRLASDREMDLPLDFNRWAYPSVTFIEAV